MGLTAADFASPPPGDLVPTAQELHALGIRGAGFSAADRIMLMNAIGFLLGIPYAAWDVGQSRLFVDRDVRLVWELRKLAHQKHAQAVARNLGAAARFFGADLMLTVVTAAREHASSLGASGTGTVETWKKGGLDFLAKELPKLGLDKSITRNWTPVAVYTSPETHKPVAPLEIPVQDQVLAYAAQLNASYLHHFMSVVRRLEIETQGIPTTRWTGSRIAMIVWKAYAFLAPIGRHFEKTKTVTQQAGRPFGTVSALEYVAELAGAGRAPPNVLDQILVDPELNRIEWVRIAKARAAEALFLERLWKTTRELLPM